MTRDSLARYRLLSGVLRLRRFTARELAEATGTELTTARKFLEPSNGLVRRLGRLPPDGPGGRSLEYELAPDRLEELRRQLDELHRLGITDETGVSAAGIKSAARASDAAMSSAVTDLLAAEDLLLTVFPAAGSESERAHLIRTGKVTIDTAQRALAGEFDDPYSGEVTAHLCLLRTLVQLAEVEERLRQRVAVPRALSTVAGVVASMAGIPWARIGESAGPVAGHIAGRIDALARQLDAPAAAQPPTAVARSDAPASAWIETRSHGRVAPIELRSFLSKLVNYRKQSQRQTGDLWSFTREWVALRMGRPQQEVESLESGVEDVQFSALVTYLNALGCRLQLRAVDSAGQVVASTDWSPKLVPSEFAWDGFGDPAFAPNWNIWRERANLQVSNVPLSPQLGEKSIPFSLSPGNPSPHEHIHVPYDFHEIHLNTVPTPGQVLRFDPAGEYDDLTAAARTAPPEATLS